MSSHVTSSPFSSGSYSSFPSAARPAARTPSAPASAPKASAPAQPASEALRNLSDILELHQKSQRRGTSSSPLVAPPSETLASEATMFAATQRAGGAERAAT